MKIKFLFSTLLSLMLLSSSRLQAAGAILVDTELTGLPILWPNHTVHYNLESGAAATLGSLSNAEATALVRDLFQEWQNVTINGASTVSLTVVEGDPMGSVSRDNLDSHFSYCPPSAEECVDEFTAPFVLGSANTGESPILFDDDGSMIDAVQGQGASRSILGFAGPRTIERVNGELVILEGQAILNGKFINGVSSFSDPEVSLDEFKGVILHEIGHFIGLDHTQVNLSSAVKYLSGDHSEGTAIPTMFPILIDGREQLSLHFDDKVAVSSFYPSASFEDDFCQLNGRVFYSDSRHELQGVNVVLKNKDNPLEESASFVSGSYYMGSFDHCDAPFGAYSFKGLTPGSDYTLSIETISSSFTGGSSIEPCDPGQRGFSARPVVGFFSCPEGGTSIYAGTQATADILTTKTFVASATGGRGGSPSVPTTGSGCSLIPE